MSEVVHAFTTVVPTWSPYVTPVDLATATPAQRAAMKVTPSNKGVSPYVLTLAHDPESLEVRSPLFNLIMYGRDGLPPAERELGALSTSIVNRCVYCAAVHASRFNAHTKRTDVVEAIFARELDVALDDPRQRAVFDFAAALSATPPRAGQGEREALVEAGLTPLEQLDLVLCAAIFAWANRLMHMLGEPIPVSSTRC